MPPLSIHYFIFICFSRGTSKILFLQFPQFPYKKENVSHEEIMTDFFFFVKTEKVLTSEDSDENIFQWRTKKTLPICLKLI